MNKTIYILLLYLPSILPARETTVSQSISLHQGWNLVSWHIVPLPAPFQFQQILPDEQGYEWFHDYGKLYKWTDDEHYFPDHGLGGDEIWHLDYAYYFDMETSHTWDDDRFHNQPGYWTSSDAFDFDTSPAWNDHEGTPITSDYANQWFFMGYSAPGYMKLASAPNANGLVTCGDPDDYDFVGPFHWLIWENDGQDYPLYELKVIKDDQGKAYIPAPRPDTHPDRFIDEISVLEPGKGYFLGFAHAGNYTFNGWSSWPQWEATPPEPKTNQATTSSGSHFSFNKYTHWSYPVYIDTVDQNECPMEAGDEIGVFDGDRCVGATTYNGEFPMLVTCWEDDKATPMEVDGYTDGNPMTFIWYDQSENAEIEFVPPAMTASKEEDDRVAPQYAGFGMGLYAYRSFMEGTSGTTYLPKEFRLKQNYPNPFNSSTVIPLELPQRSRVTIDLFDICGRLVWTHNAGVQNAGWPRIHFNASNLASGVYFYRVTATGLERGGRYQDVGKMLLLK